MQSDHSAVVPHYKALKTNLSIVQDTLLQISGHHEIYVGYEKNKSAQVNNTCIVPAVVGEKVCLG